MRAQTVSFERGEDPKKSMGIGKDRPIGGQQLVDTVFDNIWSKLENDPRFKNEDPIVMKDDVYGWVLAMVEGPDSDEIPVQDPNSYDLSADRYLEYWDEISGYEEPTYMGL